MMMMMMIVMMGPAILFSIRKIITPRHRPPVPSKKLNTSHSIENPPQQEIEMSMTVKDENIFSEEEPDGVG